MKRIPLSAALFFFLSPAYSQIGKVGINTTTPAAMLHVKDSSVLFSGPGVLPATPGNPPASGTGNRMMWYADKAAFRAGRASGSTWDNVNTGNYSFAGGDWTIASGDYSTAFGRLTEATGSFSTALGVGTEAHGSRSTSMGNASVAEGLASLATGDETVANGDASISAGYRTKAESFSSLAVGRYNRGVTYHATSQSHWYDDDPVFEIGNGTADNARQNALTVLKNGNTGIGIHNPTEKLVVDGKILTTNFQMTNGAGVNKVLQSDATGTASWVNSTALEITETDPKVILSAVNAVPRWNGSALQNGVIQDNGLNIGIGGAPVGGNKLTVIGKTSTTDFQMTNGAGTNKLLESSSNGTASWTDDVVLDSIKSRIINSNTVEANVVKSLITMADGFNYNSSPERILVIPASAFQLMPVNGVSTAGLTSTTIAGGQTITTGTAGVDAWFEAPVYLPDYARVKEIILHVRDASTTYEVDAELRSITTFTSALEASITGTGTTAAPGDVSISRTGLDEQIRNTKAYFLRFNSKEFNGNLRIYRAQINYTVSRAD